MLRCLIVTSDKQLRDTVRVGLEQIQPCEFRMAEDRWVVQTIRDQPFDVVIADSRLSDGTDGLDILRETRNAQPDAHLVLLAHGKSAARMASRDRDELDLAAIVRVPIATADFFRSITRLVERLGAAA